MNENFLWNMPIDKDAKNIASGIDILKKTRPFVLFEVSALNYTCK